MPRSKRLFDVVGALGGLVAFSPVMAAIAAAIVLEDGRPILFRQERVGLAQRRFTILKFRSMNGGRVTRVGRILRATGLDELPQFLNILRGDMSAVGPRPLTESDIRRLGWSGPRYDFRWRVRPGLTGLAQVIGGPSASLSACFDRWYVARRSLLLDVRLVALSFAINALGKTRIRQCLLRARAAQCTRSFPWTSSRRCGATKPLARHWHRVREGRIGG
jgi:lipopolysaccharide/colanic/teichoic acid biosynthesis glycosyltransferase